jgi:predicted O-methyltransferase YrrM
MGRGIHPPFAYRFISRAIFGMESTDNTEFSVIEEMRNTLSGEKKMLPVRDHGAGSSFFTGELRSVARLVKLTAVSPKKGRLLARIARYLDFPIILELGTGTGFSSLYMGLASPSSTLLTCEGSPALVELARENIRRSGAGNIEVCEGQFLDWLPGILNKLSGDLLLFVDGDHRGDRLIKYCEMVTGSIAGKLVLVLDDIHWSRDMYMAWTRLRDGENISLSIELCNTGILFLGYDVQKDHFIVRF